MTQYAWYRREGGLQGWSGWVREISPPTGERTPDPPARSIVATRTTLSRPALFIIIIIAYLHIYFHRAFKSPEKETYNNNLRMHGATPPNTYVFVANSPNSLNRHGYFSFFAVIWWIYWAFHVKNIAQLEIHYITKQEWIYSIRNKRTRDTEN
jgi:hypothetical protein